MINQHDPDNAPAPASEPKPEPTPVVHYDIDNGLPTPPSEPIFELIDVDEIIEVDAPSPIAEHPQPMMHATPLRRWFEDITDEDDNGAADLTINGALTSHADTQKTGESAENVLGVSNPIFICILY
jgi:hypothetical protein